MINILMLIIQFSVILAFGMFWYILLKWSAEESICMSILCIMTLIFVGGFWGQGLIAIAVIYALAFGGLLLFIFGDKVKLLQNYTGKENYRRKFFSPGIVLFALIFVYGVIAFDGLCIYNWDELHHWGKAVNYMLHNNTLPMGENYDGTEILLSSTTLFHYFVCKFPKVITGEIVESNMYVSNLILWFAAVILPLSGVKWKNWKGCLGYVATIFLLMNVMFVQPYYNIYCDQPVTMWAGALIAWNLFCKEKKYREVFIILALLHISFMKNMMGPLFAAIIILAIFIKYILQIQDELKVNIEKMSALISWKKSIFAVGCISSVVFLTLLWSWRIGQNALVRSDSATTSPSDRLTLTLKSGISKWFEPVNSSTAFPNLTYFSFLIFTIILSYIIVKKVLVGKMKKQYFVLIGFYVFGFFAFFAVMMYAYMTTFSYEDSIVTGSLNRYFADYMMLGMIPLIWPVFLGDLQGARHSMTVKIVALAVLVFGGLSTTNGFFAKVCNVSVKNSNTYKQRTKLEEYRKNIISLMSDDKRIYMVNQTSDAYFTVAADYVFEHLIDRSGMCYYFTSEDKNIPGLSYYNIWALQDVLLKEYGYLWIYKTDSYFNNNAFNVLKIKTPQNGDFYKVINNNGRLKLQYLGNVAVSEDGEE